MKFITTTLAAAVISVASFGAHAGEIKVSETDYFQVTQGSPGSFVLKFGNKFSSALQEILNARLEITLFDNVGKGQEQVEFLVGAGNSAFSKNHSNIGHSPNGQDFKVDLNSAAVADLQADGRIAFSAIANSGEFYFGAVTLFANVANKVIIDEPELPANEVPEPVTLGLFGLGLLGLGAARRRKQAK